MTGAGRAEAAVSGYAEDAQTNGDGHDEAAESAAAGGDGRHGSGGGRILQRGRRRGHDGRTEEVV
jgi:hypothetical protein